METCRHYTMNNDHDLIAEFIDLHERFSFLCVKTNSIFKKKINIREKLYVKIPHYLDCLSFFISN